MHFLAVVGRVSPGLQYILNLNFVGRLGAVYPENQRLSHFISV